MKELGFIETMTNRTLRNISLLFGLLLSVSLLSHSAFALPPQQNFVRLQEGGTSSKALQVAVADYRWKSGKTVSLVSAVHVADQEYFDNLNKLLSSYDIVLYELVGPKGVRPVQGSKRGGFLNSLQEWFANLLGAKLQLDEVDYSSPHFVHADVSFEELILEGQKRGETLFSLITAVISDMFAVQEQMKELPFQPETLPELISLWLNPGQLRTFVAHSLAHVTEDAELSGLKSLEPYLIDLRNAKAVEVLSKEAADSKAKTFAIFYGAAHMRDMEKRLVQDLGMERKRTSWLSAWDLSASRSENSSQTH